MGGSGARFHSSLLGSIGWEGGKLCVGVLLVVFKHTSSKEGPNVLVLVMVQFHDFIYLFFLNCINVN